MLLEKREQQVQHLNQAVEVADENVVREADQVQDRNVFEGRCRAFMGFIHLHIYVRVLAPDLLLLSA